MNTGCNVQGIRGGAPPSLCGGARCFLMWQYATMVMWQACAMGIGMDRRNSVRRSNFCPAPLSFLLPPYGKQQWHSCLCLRCAAMMCIIVGRPTC